MTPAQRQNFQRLLNPRHIAFVGGRDAAIAIGEARRIGFSGEFWAVNPKRECLNGLSCYREVTDLPEAPDATFLAVPVAQAVSTVRELNAMGAGGIVCYTAGFKESGEDGAAVEAELINAAGNMALIGPNCYGVINYLSNTALWPFAHGSSRVESGCAIVTQSGMLPSDITMSQRSVPITHMISIGNQAVLSIEDVIDELCEDMRIKAIGIHIEGLRDVTTFANAAIKSIRKGKPIVALKTGSSAIGQSLTASHTGSLSGEDDLYDALFERIGVIRVASPVEMLETLKFLSIAGVPEANRVAGFTCSGGGATMLADHAEKIGLEFPEFTPETRDKLIAALPPIATVSNPLDYTTPIWGQADLTRPVFAQAMNDGFDAAILVQDYPAPGLDESKQFYLADGNAFTDAANQIDIPAAICCTIPENMDAETRDHFAKLGIAPMQGINEAMDTIKAASKWGRMQKRILKNTPAELISVLLTENLAALDEAEAKAMLRQGGITVPEGRSCNSEDAPAIAKAMGFPVALKMIHKDLQHKTEVGAVKLNLRNQAEIHDAISDINSSVQKLQPAASNNRYLVESMQSEPIAELLVNIRQDRQFGLAMTLGSGGILVELVADAVTLLLPATQSDIVETLMKLKVSRLLKGFRGKPVADLSAVAGELIAIAKFAEVNKHKIAEMELNPVFVYPDRLCAVDTLIHIHANTD